jgi:hypothetical protein
MSWKPPLTIDQMRRFAKKSLGSPVYLGYYNSREGDMRDY